MHILLNTKGLVITFYQNVRRAGFKVSWMTTENLSPACRALAIDWSESLKAQERGELSEDVHL